MAGKRRGNNLESFLYVYIIAKASSDNIFIKKCGGGVKASPMSTRKWGESGQKVSFGKWQKMAGRWVKIAWKAFFL